MTITFYGEPRTKKNHQNVVPVKKKGGGVFYKPLPSKAYVKYEEDCLRQLTRPMRQEIGEPVNVKCLYYMQTRRIVDLVGLLQATDDILVKGKVLVDDNSRVIVSHDGSRVLYDKNNPRAEITIEAADDYDFQLTMSDI